MNCSLVTLYKDIAFLGGGHALLLTNSLPVMRNFNWNRTEHEVPLGKTWIHTRNASNRTTNAHRFD